ncbi:hypothetical protein FRC08_017458 [Ceratobasidium sp. 394]|nr:hypothetical protein FRC08_017458 [Ceratobasidium sp. 394]
MSSPVPDGRHSPEAGQRILITYVTANGGRESVLAPLSGSYDELLHEACVRLEPHLPRNWQNRRRDFARKVLDRQGRMSWATVEPASLLQLGQLGQLPELRLRVYPSEDDMDAQSQRSVDTRIPAYEAIQGAGLLDAASGSRVASTFIDNASGRPSLANLLRASSALYLARDYRNTIKTLRAAYDTFQDAGERAQIFLWIGQISFELKEFHNATSDLTIACDAFKANGDHNNRLECELTLAKILRTRSGDRDITPLLLGLLQDAQGSNARIAEVHILFNLCEIACGANNLAEAASRAEHIKVVAQETGDLWCEATESRALGLINEAGSDFVTGLESYSRALGLYRGATPRSPISPSREVEVAVQRMRYNLSIPAAPPPDWKKEVREYVTTKVRGIRESLRRRN